MTRTATAHAVQTVSRLQSVPGSGQSLALVLLYAIQDRPRFPRGPDCVSYCPLVKCAKESAGKGLGSSGKKIGQGPLRWAGAEAAVLCLRHHPPGQAYLTQLAHQPGKAQALTVLAHKLARAVDDLLSRAHGVDLQRLVTASPLRGGTAPAPSLADAGQSLRAAHSRCSPDCERASGYAARSPTR